MPGCTVHAVNVFLVLRSGTSRGLFLYSISCQLRFLRQSELQTTIGDRWQRPNCAVDYPEKWTTTARHQWSVDSPKSRSGAHLARPRYKRLMIQTCCLRIHKELLRVRQALHHELRTPLLFPSFFDDALLEIQKSVNALTHSRVPTFQRSNDCRSADQRCLTWKASLLLGQRVQNVYRWCKLLLTLSHGGRCRNMIACDAIHAM